MSLINTKYLPPGFSRQRNTALEATAYHNGNPYPYFGFPTWKTEELGPYPKCMPIPYAIVRRSAIWLFGKPLQLNFNSHRPIEKEIRRLWKLNKMDSRLVALATQAGYEGEIAVMFEHDATKPIPIRFFFLSTVNEVKFFYNPHDLDEVLMVRIQYPYFDGNDGKWKWYRKEITKDLIVMYYPEEIKNYNVNPANPFQQLGEPIFPAIDTQTEWKIQSQKRNPYGLINVVKIKNIDSGSEYGLGDLWGMFRTVDRINLAYNIFDVALQKHVNPHKVYIDVEPKDQDSLDRPDGPGTMDDVQSIKEDNENARKGDVKFLELRGEMLGHLGEYLNDLKQMLFDATGAVFTRQEAVTNKGSLTQSVLIQVNKPLLEITDEKRKSYGANGLCVLLNTMILGLKNKGVQPYKNLSLKVNSVYDEKLDTTITWFDQFKMSEDEKFAVFDRVEREFVGGFTSAELAIDRINQLEEVEMSDEERTKLVEVLNERRESELEKLNASGVEQEQSEKSNSRRGNDSGGTEDNQAQQNREARKRQQKRGNRVKDAT